MTDEPTIKPQANIELLMADLDTAVRSAFPSQLFERSGFVSEGGVGDHVSVEVIRHQPAETTDVCDPDSPQPLP